FINELDNVVNVKGVGLFFWAGYYPILAGRLGSTIKKMLPVEFVEPFTVEEETYINQSFVSQIELKVNDNINYEGSDPTGVGVLQRNIVWESSPLVRERIFVKDAKPGADVLVYRPDNARKNYINVTSGEPLYNFLLGEPLVVFNTYGLGRVLWISMGVGFIKANFSRYNTTGIGPFWNRTRIEEEGSTFIVDNEWNKPFYLWPYFNYFIYQSAMYLSNHSANEIDTYAKWPYSPIPHETEATIWMIFVAGLWVFNFVLFFSLGKRKKKRKEGEKEEKYEGGEGEGKGEEETKKDEEQASEKSQIDTTQSDDDSKEKDKLENVNEKPNEEKENETPDDGTKASKNNDEKTQTDK
ncbi:MAG: hypothetical protein ACTSWN_13870, partial [Promethearchaeota archaeon]